MGTLSLRTSGLKRHAKVRRQSAKGAQKPAPAAVLVQVAQRQRRRREIRVGLASSDFVHADVNEPMIVDGLAGLDLSAPQDAAAAVCDRPIGIRLLFEDPNSGEEHYLVRYPPGVRGRAHRHTAAHTMVVLEGQLDLGDRVVGPGRTFTFLVRRECAIRPPLTVRAYSSSSSTGRSTSRSSTEVPTGPLSATQPWL